MDCQFLMGMFSNMYFQSFIKQSALGVGGVLELIVRNLNQEQQMELFESLGELLTEQHLLPSIQPDGRVAY